MCAKIQAMLFSGKHHPHQIASNLTYVSRSYTQNFLAYSPIDDLLIFLEPKYQLHVYTAQDARLVGHIPAMNVVYASSCLSIMTGDRYDLCFIYESRMKTNIISIRVCEVRFNLTKLQFEDKKCIDSTIRSDRANIRINGFTIKRDHFGTKRSLLFVSTTFGLIYTIFDMRTYVNIRKPIILNDTLTEGSAVLTSAGVVYYANKEEHTIHEIHVTKDFRIRYGKIIKSNAIKSPFGLITDECNHLFIATKTMVLVMYMQSYTTIRSIFLRPSDFPITMERINSSSYIYATVKKQSGKIPAKWLFNIFSFADPSLATTTTPRSELDTTEKVLTTTQPPSVSTLQTSTSSATTVITEQSSRSTFSKESSSSLMTSYPMVTSIVSSQMTTTTDNLITLPTSNRIFETSSVSTMTKESRTTDYETYMTTLITTSTSLDSTTIIQTTNEPSTLLPSTIATDQMTSSTTDSITSETTFIPSTFSTTITTIYTEEYTSNLISTESLQKSSTILSTLLTDHFSEEYSLTSTEASISTNNQELEEYSSIPSSSEVSSTFSSPMNDQYFDDSNSTQLWSEESSPFSSVVTDEYSEVYTSTQSYTDETSTIFSDISNSESDYSTLVITSASSQSDHSTTVSHQTDTPTMTSPNVEITTQRTTTMETSTVLLTTTNEKDLIKSPFTTWYSKLNPLRDQQITTSKPSLARNLSRTLLSNELLHQLFTNTSNSSSQRLISFDLSDLPASSWNLSLQTNESIVLDIVLPDSSNSNATTNLSITKIEADRFTTNIVGSPINLHVDQIHTKQFTLAMNLTNNLTNQVSSDVVIGHVKSEQFQMDITKSDNMNIHVTQVDSETAELFFDSKFCTNDTNLQINLNLTKNGTIRYGDRPPIRIGPVFTRVHMLKQSCDLNQPFTVFFDICQGQNPCLNGGTCQSQTPDYDDPSYVPKESEISYKCICPIYVFGEQCEQSQYPLGYCINEGTLTYIIDINNRSIEKCLCARGFEGEHCEENMDDCVGVRCSNHGICQDEINSYTCSCFDGYYGSQCEQRNVETVLLQVASKSFATVAIMLIVGIASLVVISDIHTYLTRKKQVIRRKVSRVPRTSSELYESSVLLLAFGDAPIEMNEIPNVRGRRRKRPPPASGKKRPVKKKRQTSDQRQTKKKYKKTPPKTSSKNSTITNPAYETIL
ncbi:hypothetical protein I4U23_002888 [Adineta vaga]|nr:hypothetical protein I4U23_002888 [Adineta vaga]